LKVFFLGVLSIQCKMRRNRPSDTRWSTSRCSRPNRPVGYSLPVKISTFLWARDFMTIAASGVIKGRRV